MRASLFYVSIVVHCDSGLVTSTIVSCDSCYESCRSQCGVPLAKVWLTWKSHV